MTTSSHPQNPSHRRLTRLVLAMVAMVAFLVGQAGLAAASAATVSSAPLIAMAATPSGNGYWQVASDGGVFNFGDARFFGSMGGQPLVAPIVGMAVTPTGAGYWLVASDGGIFAFGDAPFYGSMGGQPLNKPVVGITATASGGGYWLVASDGGIFAFGDAPFYGSMGGKPLNKPVVTIARSASGRGYWLAASDGGIFAFGDAGFYGSTGSLVLNLPVVGMARTVSGAGYWEVASDGGIFSFGNARFYDHAIYTGGSGGTAAQLAGRLLASTSTWSTVHSSGVVDNANAYRELVDTAAGNPATLSCYGTAPKPCTSQKPRVVALSPTMLSALLEITQGQVVRASEIAGGSHSSASLHYKGTAFDLDMIGGVGGGGNSMTYKVADPVVAICKAQGAKEYWLETTKGVAATPNANGNHVHCGW